MGALFAARGPHLQALMTAAIETGCRVGELLSLQWQQVRFDLNEIHFLAKNTKARRARNLPMSQRLRSLLEMRRSIRPALSGRQRRSCSETRSAVAPRVSRRLGECAVEGVWTRCQAEEERPSDGGVSRATFHHQSAVSRSTPRSWLTIPQGDGGRLRAAVPRPREAEHDKPILERESRRYEFPPLNDLSKCAPRKSARPRVETGGNHAVRWRST